MSNCFPRHHRVKTWPEFKQVLRKGKRFYHPYLTLYHYPNGLEISRLGVIISKRNVRLATRRNTMRRIARETYRCSARQIPGMDCVVIFQAGANKGNKRLLKQCLEQLITKLVSRK